MTLAHPELVKSLVAISVGHPKAYARSGLQQKLKGLYVLGFQFTGIAEYMLSKNNFLCLRRWGYQHTVIKDVIQGMARPERLTASLNYYRVNLVDVFLTAWPNCKVPVLGIWSTADAFLTEDQMVNSEKYMDANWEYIRLEKMEYWIPLEQPEQLFTLTDEWFQK